VSDLDEFCKSLSYCLQTILDLITIRNNPFNCLWKNHVLLCQGLNNCKLNLSWRRFFARPTKKRLREPVVLIGSWKRVNRFQINQVYAGVIHLVSYINVGSLKCNNAHKCTAMSVLHLYSGKLFSFSAD